MLGLPRSPLRRSCLGRVVVLSYCMLACSGSDDGDGNAGDNAGDTTAVQPPGSSGFDPDLAPVTEGDWYRPDVTTTWQWQLVGEVNTEYDVAVYDIDLFDNAPTTISELQAAGRMVVCYFSAGSSEDWRGDFSRFEEADLGLELDEWEGERWLDVTSENVLQIMLDRLDLAASKGCDGVEPDNMDGFANQTGFELTAAHQLGYNRRIANEAHDRGLSVLLKNDGDQAESLVDYFDASLNEECHAYDECGQQAPFTDAGKPIFNAEYADSEPEAAARVPELCAAAAAANTRTLLLPWDLDDSFRFACD
jgi:hypothetical protein